MDERTHGLSRREMLAGTATLLALPGCQSIGSEEVAGPVTVADGDNCDQCGMVISEQPGPVGETYYRNNTPAGGGEAATFCSTVCTYRHRFATEREGWTPAATFLTDYSAVDYEVRTDGGAAVLTHHLDATAFAPTADLTVVAGTDIQGSMGATLVAFGDSADAEAFAEEYGGQTLPAEDIQRQLVNGA